MKTGFLIVVGGRIMSALLALLTLRLATEDLSPDQYGELALLMAIQFGCSLLLVSPLTQHINRHTHAWWDAGSLPGRLRQFLVYLAAVGVFAACLGLFCLGGQPGRQAWVVGLTLFVMVFAANWSATILYILNMLGFRGSAVLWTLTGAVFALGSSIGMVKAFPSAWAWFAGQAAGLTVSGVGATWALHKEIHRAGHPSVHEALLDKSVLITYCLPLALATGLMWVQLSGWRFLSVHYWGLAMTGVLVVGVSLAAQLWALVESMAMQYLYPLFFRRIADADHQTGTQSLSDLMNVLGPVYLVLTGATLMAAPLLVRILVDVRYAEAAAFVVYGAMIECCRVLANLLGNAAQLTRKTSGFAIPYFCGALVSVVFMTWAGYRNLDIRLGVTALLAGALIMLSVMYVLMHRLVPFTLDKPRWLAGLVILFVMAAISVLLTAPDGIWGVLFLTIGIGVLTLFVIGLLLWRNAALQRLLSVNLRGGEVKT